MLFRSQFVGEPGERRARIAQHIGTLALRHLLRVDADANDVLGEVERGKLTETLAGMAFLRGEPRGW